MKAVLISKYYKGHLDKAVEETGSLSSISGRCSGDTTGYIHILIGNLMNKNYPYTVSISNIVQEIGCTGEEAKRILCTAKHLIKHLGYNYFNLNGKERISYEPWL